MKLVVRKYLNSWYAIKCGDTFIKQFDGQTRLFLSRDSAMKCIRRINSGDKNKELRLA